MTDNSTYIVVLLFATAIILWIFYEIIKAAVKSALLDIEYRKTNIDLKEKERIDLLLQQGKITREEYARRALCLPVKLMHPE